MKKHISKLLITIGIVVLCLAGCSLVGKSAITLEDGVLSWKTVKSAIGYEVSSGNTTVFCDEASVELSKVCNLPGDYTISVSSVSSKGRKKEVGTYDVTVVALAKPAVSISETEKGETCFSWKAEENVTYNYNLHDGYGLKTAKNEDGLCSVITKNNASTMFSVIAKSMSEGNTYYP